MLPEGAVCTYAVRLNRVLNDSVGMHASERRADEGCILHQEALVDADARDVECVRASDCTNTVDARIERREATPSHPCAAGEFRGAERVTKEEADFADEGRDADDLPRQKTRC